MGKTTIRPATHDDLDLLMPIAEAMHKESPRYSKLAFSHAKVLQLYINLINSDACLLLIAERDGEILGGVAGFVSPHWFSDDLVANEYGVFILPDHRGGMTAVRLVRGYIDWAKSKGAQMIQMGISTGVHVEETEALYQAIGLKQFSVGFEV